MLYEVITHLMRQSQNLPTAKECLQSCNGIFSHLTPEEIELITYDRKCEVYKKGSILFQDGKKITNFYCIHSGIVKKYKTGLEGKEQIISFSQSGDIIGYRTILSKELACATAKVIDDVKALPIPGEILIQIMEQNSQFAIDLMRLACKELGDAHQFLTNIAQKSVRERLAEVLVKLKEIFSVDQNGFIKVMLTREEVASLVGTATSYNFV